MIETIDDFQVVPGSAVIGERASKINEKYNVRVLRIYTLPEKSSKPLDRLIEERDYIKVHGSYENVTKLLKDATTKHII